MNDEVIVNGFFFPIMLPSVYCLVLEVLMNGLELFAAKNLHVTSIINDKFF